VLAHGGGGGDGGGGGGEGMGVGDPRKGHAGKAAAGGGHRHVDQTAPSAYDVKRHDLVWNYQTTVRRCRLTP